jgi:hypothetical protein
MKKTKMEFSKKIFYMVTIFTVVVIIYSMALMWKTGDSSALSYLIPSVFGEMSVATGFYFSKAKKENEIKLLKKYGKETIDQVNEMEE